MSQFSFARFPDGMPASELPSLPTLLDTRRGRRAQREVDAALDLSEGNPPVRTTFMGATPTVVVFSDESSGAGTHQGLL